jgi:hypothetical protein
MLKPRKGLMMMGSRVLFTWQSTAGIQLLPEVEPNQNQPRRPGSISCSPHRTVHPQDQGGTERRGGEGILVIAAATAAATVGLGHLLRVWPV